MDRKTLTRIDWDQSIIDAFGPSVEANPWGWGTAEEVLRGSTAFEYRSGRQHALVAMRAVDRSAGRRLDITGLVSLGDRLVSSEFDAAVETIAQLNGARAVAMATIRPHIVAACKRAGWTPAGTLMVKTITKALQ